MVWVEVFMEYSLEPLQVVGLGHNRLERHWDDKLSSTKDNPFPLAPKDLVRMGLVTEENYQEQNQQFGRFCNSIMESELLGLSSIPRFSSVPCPEIRILGIGLAERDLLWVRAAVYSRFYIKAYDVSRVACDNLLSLTESLPYTHKIDVIHGEIEDLWQEIRITPDMEIPLCYGSQFIQVLKKTKMKRVVRRLGDHVAGGVNTCLGRSVCIVHPLSEDNKRSRQWNKHCIPSVEWGDTTPYSREELLNALGIKARRAGVDIDLLGVHQYFHQTYSFLKISLKG